MLELKPQTRGPGAQLLDETAGPENVDAGFHDMHLGLY